jgi:hypothetical protein
MWIRTAYAPVAGPPRKFFLKFEKNFGKLLTFVSGGRMKKSDDRGA